VGSNDTDIRQRIARCRSLPTLPAAAIELLDLWKDEDVGIVQIAGVIKKDPALAAKLLRISNSPHYGFKAKIGTIERAVSMLGLNATLSLCLGFSLVRDRGRGRGKGMDYDAFWRRSGLTAAAARTVGSRMGLPNIEEVFLGGLLQDIGMLVLLETLGEDYTALVTVAAGDHDRLVAAERAVLLDDHGAFGAELAERWGFPENLVNAVRMSHTPEATPARPELATFARTVACAAKLADCFMPGQKRDERATVAQVAIALASSLGQHRDDVADILRKTGEAAADVSSVLEIDFGSQAEIEDAREEAREALVMLNVEAEMQARLSASQVDQLAAQKAELEDRVNRDPLTGIANRAFLDRALCALFARAIEACGVFSVAFVDLDCFKSINDLHGHLVGDAVLTAVAATLQATLRPSDVLGRYGGEEFLVLLPGANAAGAAVVAERLRAQLEAVDVEAHHEAIRVTASFGIATQAGRAPFDSATGLLRAADAAMYEAKQRGRNRVESSRRKP
jgi:diguanylate cyclase (GGDEF)-like protein